MNKPLSKGIAITLAGIMFFASCTSTTLIQSTPSGAKVYLNEEYAGVTPYSHSDTKIVGSTTYVRLEKEGYETLNTSITKNEDADVGAIIGGFFLLVPFLWTMKYKPFHNYELKPLNTASVEDDSSSSDSLKGLTRDEAGNEYISGVLLD